MRYFDGEMWTNHFHSPDKAPDVGSWLNNTFSAIGTHGVGAFVLAFTSSLLGGLVTWLSLRAILNDVELRDEALVNMSGAKSILLIAVVLFGIAWQGLGWLAVNRFMQRAHSQANPTIAEAVRHAVARLPKYLGIVLALVAAGLLAMIVLVTLLIVAPVVGLLLVLLAIPALVWVAVKLAFLTAAVAAAPADTGALRASADVSAGRFWPVAGRVIIFSLGIGLIGSIFSSVLGDLAATVNVDALTGIFEVDGEDLIVNDFVVSDLFPASGKLLVALVVGSVLRAVTTMVTTSAFMRLYLDVGAPSEIAGSDSR